MNLIYVELTLAKTIRAFHRTYRAYFARRDVLTHEHDEQLYWLARQVAHEARIILGESR